MLRVQFLPKKASLLDIKLLHEKAPPPLILRVQFLPKRPSHVKR